MRLSAITGMYSASHWHRERVSVVRSLWFALSGGGAEHRLRLECGRLGLLEGGATVLSCTITTMRIVGSFHFHVRDRAIDCFRSVSVASLLFLYHIIRYHQNDVKPRVLYPEPKYSKRILQKQISNLVFFQPCAPQPQIVPRVVKKKKSCSQKVFEKSDWQLTEAINI